MNYRRILLFITILLIFLFGTAHIAFSYQAGLVVKHGDGRVVIKCVEFDAESISGVELLEKSGLEFSSDGYGVFKIDGEGAEESFIKKGDKWIYWHYWHFENGEWVFSHLYPGMYRLKDKDIDGYVFSGGGFESGSPPPMINSSDIFKTEVMTTPQSEEQKEESIQSKDEEKNKVEANKEVSGNKDNEKIQGEKETTSNQTKMKKDEPKNIKSGSEKKSKKSNKNIINYIIFSLVSLGLISAASLLYLKNKKRFKK